MATQRKKSRSKKAPVEKNQGVSPFVLGILSVVVCVAVLYFSYTHYSVPPQEEIAALVNGEYITKTELSKQYSFLPPFMQESLTEATFLPLLIDQTVLEQEARTLGYTATDSEAYEFIRQSIIASGLTEEEFFTRLSEASGPTKDDLMEHYRTQISINKLINASVMSHLQVTDERILEVYTTNDFLDVNGTKRPLEEVKESIKTQLQSQMGQEGYAQYMQTLRDKAEVTIYYTQENKVSSFTPTTDPLCPSDDIPFVFFFGSSDCEYCSQIEEPFKNAIKDAVALNKINAHFYNLDTQDDIFTEIVETEIPQGHLGLFDYYSPDRQIPLVVFGCRYIRLGTGTGDVVLEEAEFRKMLNVVLEEYERR